MNDSRIIDGKAIAQDLRAKVRDEVIAFKRECGVRPGLAVVLVGSNPASEIYVRNKIKQAAETGIVSIERRLPETVSENELLSTIDELNRDRNVHGILVQLPLPMHISSDKILRSIRPEKDVDGFHPLNAGNLSVGLPGLIPCTPSGVLYLIKSVSPDISGLRAVVVGRSNIVGKPVAQLLLAANATVTLAHSKTIDLPAVCAQADILVAAVGKPEVVRGNWIKNGAIVIDVGINRIDVPRPRIVGDVAYAEALGVAGAITPVPGGVGPMTIACLLENTLTAAKIQRST